MSWKALMYGFEAEVRKEQFSHRLYQLQPTPEQVVKIEATLKAFADACNYTNERVKPQITSKTTIQGIVYEDLRSNFGLAANLAVRACARVGANRLAAKQKSKPAQRFSNQLALTMMLESSLFGKKIRLLA